MKYLFPDSIRELWGVKNILQLGVYMCLSLYECLKTIPMFGLMSDVCNNVLESCICVMYVTVMIICLFVDQQNRKLHTVVRPPPISADSVSAVSIIHALP
jgi:hypothetical protein